MAVETASIIIIVEEQNGEAEAEQTATVEEPTLGGATEEKTVESRVPLLREVQARQAAAEVNIVTETITGVAPVASEARRSLFPLLTIIEKERTKEIETEREAKEEENPSAEVGTEAMVSVVGGSKPPVRPRAEEREWCVALAISSKVTTAEEAATTTIAIATTRRYPQVDNDRRDTAGQI